MSPIIIIFFQVLLGFNPCYYVLVTLSSVITYRLTYLDVSCLNTSLAVYNNVNYLIS